jgi:uncharacterized protein YjbI with pentapeptide repeats
MQKVESPLELENLLKTVSCQNISIRRLDLTGNPLDRKRFSSCEFVEVLFGGARAQGASFQNCLFSGCHLRGAMLSGVTMEDTCVKLSEAMEITLAHCELIGVQFEDVPLSNANLEGAEVVGCTFDTSSLYGARFSDATIIRSRFLDKRLGNAILSMASLQRALVVESDFSGADFRRANLSGALFVRCVLDDVNLEEAELEEARFVDCSLARVSANEAKLARAVARPKEFVSDLANFLTTFDHSRLARALHAFVTGYVLRHTRVPERPAPPPEPSQPQAEKGTQSEAQERQVPDMAPKPAQSRVQEEIKDTGSKKIELD